MPLVYDVCFVTRVKITLFFLFCVFPKDSRVYDLFSNFLSLLSFRSYLSPSALDKKNDRSFAFFVVQRKIVNRVYSNDPKMPITLYR